MAVALMVKDQVFKTGTRHAARAHLLWQHSSIAGVYAQNVGRLRRGDHEASMLIGLLHDIGKPLMLQFLMEVEKDLGIELDREVSDYILDEVHAEVGAHLARTWALPEALECAIAFHHDYEEATEHVDAARTAYLADRLAHWALKPDERQGQNLRDLPVIAELDLPRDLLGGLFSGRERILEIASAIS